MWNLERPDIADVRGHLDTVFPAVPAPPIASNADKDALISLYGDYETAHGHPEPGLLGNGLSVQLRQAVHDAYSEVQEKGKLSALRTALKLIAEECPYCGFGQIQDLDHHLPRGVYKPFSIFALNLVPSCATCNRRKSRVPKADPTKHLLHAYLEDVSAYDFLRTAILLDATDGSLQVRFSVAKPGGMSDELHSRLVNHFVEFGLHERYPAQANIYLSGLHTAFELAFNSGGGGALRAFLERSAEKSIERFGINDWRTALLRGLAHSNEFCDGGFVAALGY